MILKENYKGARRLLISVLSSLVLLSACSVYAQRTCGTILPEEPICGMPNPIYRLPVMAERALEILHSPDPKYGRLIPPGRGYAYWGYRRTEEEKAEQKELVRKFDAGIEHFNNSNEYGLRLPTSRRFWWSLGIEPEDNPWKIMGKVEDFLRQAREAEEVDLVPERNCWKPVQARLVGEYDDETGSSETAAVCTVSGKIEAEGSENADVRSGGDDSAEPAENTSNISEVSSQPVDDDEDDSVAGSLEQ